MKKAAHLIDNIIANYKYYQLQIALISGLFAFLILTTIYWKQSTVLPIPTAVELPDISHISTPNQSTRPDFATISYVVILVINDTNINNYFERIKSHKSRFSVHYMVTPTGSLYQHVEEDKRAMSMLAGRFPDGRHEVNELSISIALLYSDSDELYSSQQISVLKALLEQLTKKYRIKHIVTESQISLEPKSNFMDLSFPFEQLPEFKKYLK